jgi:hypothetical protein
MNPTEDRYARFRLAQVTLEAAGIARGFDPPRPGLLPAALALDLDRSRRIRESGSEYGEELS